MTSKLKENVIALFVALLLTFGVIVAVNNSSNLATNILGVKNTSVVKADIKLNYQSGTAEIVSNKNIDNVSSVSLELLFDKNKVSIKKDNFDSDYNIALSEKEGANGYTVIIQNIGQIKKNNSILKIRNISKKQFDNINIGHIQVISNNGKIVNLTVSK